MAHPDTLARGAYSVEEAVRTLGISRRSAYRLIAAGELRTVKLGGRRLVPAAELARLIGLRADAPSGFANCEDFESHDRQSIAPPENPQAPTEQPVRVSLSELLARVREPSAGR